MPSKRGFVAVLAFHLSSIAAGELMRQEEDWTLIAADAVPPFAPSVPSVPAAVPANRISIAVTPQFVQTRNAPPTASPGPNALAAVPANKISIPSGPNVLHKLGSLVGVGQLGQGRTAMTENPKVSGSVPPLAPPGPQAFAAVPSKKISMPTGPNVLQKLGSLVGVRQVGQGRAAITENPKVSSPVPPLAPSGPNALAAVPADKISIAVTPHFVQTHNVPPAASSGPNALPAVPANKISNAVTPHLVQTNHASTAAAPHVAQIHEGGNTSPPNVVQNKMTTSGGNADVANHVAPAMLSTVKQFPSFVSAASWAEKFNITAGQSIQVLGLDKKRWVVGKVLSVAGGKVSVAMLWKGQWYLKKYTRGQALAAAARKLPVWKVGDQVKVVGMHDMWIFAHVTKVGTDGSVTFRAVEGTLVYEKDLPKAKTTSSFIKRVVTHPFRVADDVNVLYKKRWVAGHVTAISSNGDVHLKVETKAGKFLYAKFTKKQATWLNIQAA